jgi:hypothetical protein
MDKKVGYDILEENFTFLVVKPKRLAVFMKHMM